MTTITYHNDILACDSRSSFSERKMKCRTCDDEVIPAADDSIKIQSLLSCNTTFNGEKMLAVGQAGRLNHSRKAVRLLKKHGEKILDVYRNFAEVYLEKGQQQAAWPNFSLLIVTDKSVYSLRAVEDFMEMKQFERTSPVANGSGAPAARVAMTVMGTGAIDAVCVAACMDEATGGDIHYIDCNDPEGTVHTEKVEHSKEELLVKIKKDYIRVGSDKAWAAMDMAPSDPVQRKPRASKTKLTATRRRTSKT